MMLKFKKCLLASLSAVILLFISCNTSYSKSIEDDFQNLQNNLPLLKKKNLLFLDPTSDKNYGARSEDAKELMIIVHHTVTSTLRETKNALSSRGISVHFIVDKDGSITLMVPLEKEAWHAGISYAKVRVNGDVRELKSLNSYSIGIEIVNTGLEPFSDIQMHSIKDLILYLMKRFDIEKHMIFSHAEIGTIVYNGELESYVMRKPDPHKLFDWELLAQNGIGVHISNNISHKKAEKQINSVLYRSGDKHANILRLKHRLNKLFYKILPWNNKDGKIIFPDDVEQYSDEFDEVFSWVIYQFSMRNLPKEIRKDLLLKLEKHDILPIKLLYQYNNAAHAKFQKLKIDVSHVLKPLLSKEEFIHTETILTEYENDVFHNMFVNFVENTKIYYNSYLRYKIELPMHYNVLKKLDVLQGSLLSISAIAPKANNKISELIQEFRTSVYLRSKTFNKDWLQEFKNAWKQEFMQTLRKEIKWTALHETTLDYLEKNIA